MSYGILCCYPKCRSYAAIRIGKFTLCDRHGDAALIEKGIKEPIVNITAKDHQGREGMESEKEQKARWKQPPFLNRTTF